MLVRRPHDRHSTSNSVPWISMTLAGSLPARWCSPSMFCVTIARSRPDRSSVDQREVSGVGPRVPCGVVEPVAPGQLAHAGSAR